MRANYKVPEHIRRKISTELFQYWENKRQLTEMGMDIIESSPIKDETGIRSKYQISKPTETKAIKIADLSTRAMIEASRRIRYVEDAMKRLNKEEKEVAEYIFRDRLSQQQAEMKKGVSYDSYYNVKSKIIYLTAVEYGDI